MTVMRSATFITSLSLWVIRIEEMPCALNSLQQLQQRVGIRFVQARRRLVEDQQLHLLVQRLGDLDQLLLAGADIGDQRVGVFLEADLVQQLLGAARRPRTS